MGLSPAAISLMPSMPALAVLVFILTGAGIADAYADTSAFCRASSPSLRSSSRRFSACQVQRGFHKQRDADSPLTLYLFPTPPSILAANYPQNHPHPPPRPSPSGHGTTTRLPMGSAVLAESDVLPEFCAAHGLLSPEVVSRIADANDLDLGSPLHTFLKTYKRRGPMACLPLLSDPCVLPVLTRAMREIA